MARLDNVIAKVKEWHSGQTYGDQSYWDGHLSVCLELAKQYMPNEVYTNRRIRDTFEDIFLIPVVCHDVLEDTSIEFIELARHIGQDTYVVEAVTDDKGKNRKERKLNTYRKIRREGQIALFVKLIDRLANVKAKTKNDMYRKEHYTFKCALDDGIVFQDIWEAIEKELDWKI